MRNSWSLLLVAATLLIIFVGCGPESNTLLPTMTLPPPTSVPTNTAVPPTDLPPTQLPTSTEPPPTAIPPTNTPTQEPTPTNTPVPHATFKGCIYFEEELVVGYFTFNNALNRIEHLTTQTTDGCATIRLRPGYYEIGAAYYQGPVCAYRAAGCVSARIEVEVVGDELIEGDFEVVPAGSVLN